MGSGTRLLHSRSFRGEVTLCLITVTAFCVSTALAGGEKPNIIFILADDLGWVDISTGATNYGNPSDFYETPNIERLAQRGMSFTSVYAQPNCTPTRGALLSGQYPPRTRVYNVGNLNRGTGTLLGPAQREDLVPGVVTTAETLKTAGYTTVHLGKYHVGGHEGGNATMPLNQGFDFNFGGGEAGSPGNYFASSDGGTWRFGGRIGPELDPYAEPYDAAYVAEHGLASSLIGTPKHVTDALTDAVIDVLREQIHKPGPFYIQLNHFAIHSPNQGRPDLVAKYNAKRASNPSRMGHDNIQVAALIEGLDESVGRVLDFVDDPDGDGDGGDGIARDTLLLFLSDNGGDNRTSNAPLRGRKGMLTDGALRVPLIAAMPGTIAAGVVNDALIHVVDFYTTFAEFAGAALPGEETQPLDGLSLAPLLRGESATLPREAIYYHFPGYLDTRAVPTSAIIKKIDGVRYKLLFFYEDRHTELYNLTDDLSEMTDLLAAWPGDRAQILDLEFDLLSDLRAWLDRVGAIYPTERATGNVVPPPDPTPPPPPPPPPDPPPALVYEGFEIPAGRLAGRGSGVGWSAGSSWSETAFNQLFAVKSPGQGFPGLASAGGRAERESFRGRGAVGREVGAAERASLTEPGGELWFSVLAQNPEPEDSTFETLLFLFSSVRLEDDDGSATDLIDFDLAAEMAVGFTLDPNDSLGGGIRGVVFDGNTDGSGASARTTGAFALVDQRRTHFVAARVNWSQGNTGHRLALHVLTPADNPEHVSPLPLPEPVGEMTFDLDPAALRFVTFGGRRWAGIDEIRLGTRPTAVGFQGSEPLFQRADANADGQIDLSDPIGVLGFLFLGDPAPSCLSASDSDDSGEIEITDAIVVLQYLFAGGAPPAPPFVQCGVDPTPDESGCGEFPPCN